MGLMGRFFATAALVPLSLAILVPVSGGCVAKTGAADEKVCTPGNYVFCRCANRAEGTKLCNADAKTFGACQPCPDDPPPDMTTGSTDPTGGDAGFTMVDSATPPTVGDAGPAIEAKCVNKLAVIAGSKSDVFTGIFTGDRSFSVSTSHGPGVGSPVAMAALNGSMVAVYKAGMYTALLATIRVLRPW